MSSMDEPNECPECGSSALTEKGVRVSGNSQSYERFWSACINCGWEEE